MADLPGAIRLDVVGDPLDDGVQGGKVGATEPMVGPPLDDGIQAGKEGSRTGAGGGGPGIVDYFKMRCRDSGLAPPGYVSWTVTGAPDDDASEATLVGTASDIVVTDTWQV